MTDLQYIGDTPLCPESTVADIYIMIFVYISISIHIYRYSMHTHIDVYSVWPEIINIHAVTNSYNDASRGTPRDPSGVWPSIFSMVRRHVSKIFLEVLGGGLGDLSDHENGGSHTPGHHVHISRCTCKIIRNSFDGYVFGTLWVPECRKIEAQTAIQARSGKTYHEKVTSTDSRDPG